MPNLSTFLHSGGVSGAVSPPPPPPPPPPPTLGALSFSNTNFLTTASAGDTIGFITGKTAGSTLSIIPNDGRLAIAATPDRLLVGLTSSSAGTISYTIRETLGGQTHDNAISVTVSVPGSVPVLQASANWTGTPGTGFNGSIPADPPRTTAKPSLRMASAWGARISGSTYRIFVDAEVAGLASGSSFGIATLNGYLENPTPVASTFGQYTYPDPRDGSTVSIQCYAFDIDVTGLLGAHATGGVDFYAEAIPVDWDGAGGHMQKRVIGPFRFYPRATQYSNTFDVGSGQTYATRKLAIAAIVAANEEAPLILYHTTANYEMEDCSAYGSYAGLKGFITEKAVGGVTATLRRAVFPTGQAEYSTAMLWDPGPDGCEWGPGMVLDMGNVGNIVNHNQTLGDGLKHPHRLNGCAVTTAEGTLDTYHWNGRPRPSGLWTSPGFFEDCTVSWMVGGISGSFLTRNVGVRGNLREAAANTYYQNKVYLNGWDAWTFWSPTNVMTIAYSNGGHVGRMWVTSNQIPDTPALLHFSNDGVEEAWSPITLGTYSTDANFSATQVAATINGHGGGWSAVKVLDGPGMSWNSGVNINTTTDGGATPTVVGSTPVNVRAVYDFHQDYWHSINQTAVSAPYTTGPVQGTILRDVSIKGETRKSYDGSGTPPFFLRLDTGAVDFCALECSNTICQSGDAGSCDNVFMRGCSSGSESWTPGGMGPYSRFEANVGNIFWNSGSPVVSPAYVNNYLVSEASVFATGQAAISSAPHSGNKVVSAADYNALKAAVQALYVSVSTGDMRPAPAQDLAVTGNKRTRSTILDGAGNTFAVPDAIGQLALGQSAVVWPV